jgi:hypothetical protein
MEPNTLHHHVITAHIQERMDVATGRRQLAEARRARRQRRPRRRWFFGGYSVPKMRSPASPKPGRM